MTTQKRIWLVACLLLLDLVPRHSNTALLKVAPRGPVWQQGITFTQSLTNPQTTSSQGAHGISSTTLSTKLGQIG